ncbi:trehalose-phosphatase [Patulibacter minatonensis]|uniref:trehalose-phosphatase n=1 Tax=Patulibacter minatonensis TaxID=298163 RepID=UPI0004786E8A|nr:trehalose-phosphatase [Patulibacter minatonensis]
MPDGPHGDLLAPLREHPDRAAILLDVDGTLAPITTRAADAAVPEATRAVVAAVVARYGLVACITGRRTEDARAMVGVDGLHYVGNHGTEILRHGADGPEVRPEIADWEPRVRELAEGLLAGTQDDGPAARDLRLEDKGPIQALHWRGADDEDASEAVAESIGARAEAEGLVLHRGRMVLELRPPVPFDKGAAVRWLLDGRPSGPALYAGDDRTDLDAFAGLRELRSAGALTHAVCVAAVDVGAPQEVSDGADVTVAGTDGVRAMLEGLLLP